MSIAPGRLLDIAPVADPVTIAQDNFEVITEELFKVMPTFQNGTATEIIGPPSLAAHGAHVLDEYWKDAWNGGWRCTAAGTPGTWRQEKFAVRAGEPGTGTIPTGYVIVDSLDNFRQKYHVGSYVWRAVSGFYDFSQLTGLTGGGSTNLDGVATVSMVLNTVAEFFVGDTLHKFILRPGTMTDAFPGDASPHMIRPDDYAASSNEKVWIRLGALESPPPFIRTLTGLTGGGSTNLDGIPTSTMPVGTICMFLISGSGPLPASAITPGYLYIYRLITGVDATASPYIIRPVDYNGVSNAKLWEPCPVHLGNLSLTGQRAGSSGTTNPVRLGLGTETPSYPLHLDNASEAAADTAEIMTAAYWARNESVLDAGGGIGTVFAGRSTTAQNVLLALVAGYFVDPVGATVTAALRFDTYALGNGQTVRLLLGVFKVLVNNTTTGITDLQVGGIDGVIAAILRYAVEVTDGTEVQIEVGSVAFMATKKGGVWANQTALKFGNQQAVTGGTLTVTWSVLSGEIRCNSNTTGITPSSGYPKLSYSVENLTSRQMNVP